MFPFFPYTNFHELNLDWVIAKTKEAMITADTAAIKADNALETATNALNYVVDYFKGEEFASKLAEDVSNIMDAMYQDGRLATIIDLQIFDRTMTTVKFMTPSEEQRSAYVKDTLETVASYLAVNSYSVCFEQGSVASRDPVPIIYKYAQGRGYMGVMGVGSFDYQDTQTISGVNYHVVYIDCSTFISLILKSITFPNSAYAYAFTHSPVEQSQLMRRSIEDQSMQKPWTIDWFNNHATANSAFIFNSSGCSLHYFAKNDGNSIQWDTSVLQQMETGDICYFGRSADYAAGDYLGTYHIGYFVRTLEELNQYGAKYQQVYKARDNMPGDLGYVVHCTNMDTLDGYGEILVIESLRSFMSKIPNGSSWLHGMTCKPWSNSGNDGKALRRTLLMDRRGDYTYYNTMTGSDAWWMSYQVDNGQLTLPSVGLSGIALQQGDDLNNYLRNGVWRVPSSTVLSSLINKPNTTLSFDLIGIGFTGTGAHGAQIAICHSSTVPRIFIRTCVSAGSPSPWREITTQA